MWDRGHCFVVTRQSTGMTLSLALQHRGQDSTGIATSDESTLHIHKSKGQVREGYRTRDMRALLGTIGLGHVRYATRGNAKKEQEAQPFCERSMESFSSTTEISPIPVS